MTDYRVTFMRNLVGIDVYVRVEDEERQAVEENVVTMSDAWRLYEKWLVGRAQDIVRKTVHSTDFHADNWDWEIEEL
jgi:hypothetical protein